MGMCTNQNDTRIHLMIKVNTVYLIYSNVSEKYNVQYYAYVFISGICLFLYKKYSLVDSYNCSHFVSGCPTSSFVSYKLFERKYCRSHTIRFQMLTSKYGGHKIILEFLNSLFVFIGFPPATGAVFLGHEKHM